jgi:ATP-dependent Clp protease protease subunit
MKISKYALHLLAVAVLASAGIATFGLGLSGSLKASPVEKTTVVLTSSNTVVLSSVVDGDSVGEVLEKATALDTKEVSGVLAKAKHVVFGKKTQPIYLFLNTPGGNIQAGLELIEGLNGLNRPVSSITAFSASMGFQIAQDLKGDRLIVSHGIMMSHRGVGEFSGQFGGLEPSQSSNRYRIWAQRLKEMDELTVARSKGKQTLESYQKAYNSELWVTGPEAVDQGYADKLVQVRCDETLSGVTTHTVDFMGIPISYDLDNCPVNTSPRNIRIELLTNRGHMTLQKFRDGKGGFGPLCLQEAVIDNSRLCALDTSLSYDKIYQLKDKFVDEFENKRSHIVPMTW